MINEGADILDMGAQSTRPGSIRISAEDELKKIIPAIEFLTQKFPQIIISIDTYHSKVAEESVNTGASIINDISAGEMDKSMIETVASLERSLYLHAHERSTGNNAAASVIITI